MLLENQLFVFFNPEQVSDLCVVVENQQVFHVWRRALHSWLVESYGLTIFVEDLDFFFDVTVGFKDKKLVSDESENFFLASSLGFNERAKLGSGRGQLELVFV